MEQTRERGTHQGMGPMAMLTSGWEGLAPADGCMRILTTQLARRRRKMGLRKRTLMVNLLEIALNLARLRCAYRSQMVELAALDGLAPPHVGHQEHCHHTDQVRQLA